MRIELPRRAAGAAAAPARRSLRQATSTATGRAPRRIRAAPLRTGATALIGIEQRRARLERPEGARAPRTAPSSSTCTSSRSTPRSCSAPPQPVAFAAAAPDRRPPRPSSSSAAAPTRCTPWSATSSPAAAAPTRRAQERPALHASAPTIDAPDADAARRRRRRDIDDELAPYLVVPADLPPRIAELAQQITDGHKRARGRRRSPSSEYLQRYRYTLDLKRDERYEPLEDFLFVQKAGHCEYFASAHGRHAAHRRRAHALGQRLLRRRVEQYGHYLAVRQGDAHSWVEVWLDGAGWVTFDPTPPGAGGRRRRRRGTRCARCSTTLELAWFKYVIEYDLGKQAELERAPSGAGRGSALKATRSSGSRAARAAGRRPRPRARRPLARRARAGAAAASGACASAAAPTPARLRARAQGARAARLCPRRRRDRPRAGRAGRRRRRSGGGAVRRARRAVLRGALRRRQVDSAEARPPRAGGRRRPAERRRPPAPPDRPTGP